MRRGSWSRWFSRDDGVTAIEYGLLVALLSAAALVLAGPISQGLTQRFADSTQGPGITACAAGDTGCNAYGQLQVANLPGNSGLSLQDYGPIIATVGSPVFRAATVAGGSTPYSFSVSGTLPAGLALNASTGAITGTPTATSPERTFSVTVVDAGGRTAVASVKITISAAPTSCQLSGYTNVVGTIGQPIPTQVPSTAGCTGTVVFSVSPTLPAGLSLDSGNGRLSGTPQSASSGTYIITATDGLGSTDTRTITISVTSSVTTPSAPTVTNVVKPNQTNGLLDVSWSAPGSDGGAAIDAYALEYRTQQQGPNPAGAWVTFSGPVTTTPTRVTGLEGKKYDFRMRAHNAAGWGPYSAVFGNNAQPG